MNNFKLFNIKNFLFFSIFFSCLLYSEEANSDSDNDEPPDNIAALLFCCMDLCEKCCSCSEAVCKKISQCFKSRKKNQYKKLHLKSNPNKLISKTTRKGTK